jgi:hypothetical protein
MLVHTTNEKRTHPALPGIFLPEPSSWMPESSTTAAISARCALSVP